MIPQFRDKEDEEFAYTLLKNSIYNEYEYREMIKKHTHNWDSDRIAFMDTIIMQAAIAEHKAKQAAEAAMKARETPDE